MEIGWPLWASVREGWKSTQMLWFTSVVSPLIFLSSHSDHLCPPDQVFRWRTAGSVFWLLLLATPVLFTLRILTAAVWDEGTAGLWSPWWLGWIVVYLTCLGLLQTSHAATCTGVYMYECIPTAPPISPPPASLLLFFFFFLSHSCSCMCCCHFFASLIASCS